MSACHDVIGAEPDHVSHCGDLRIPRASPGVTPDPATFVESDSNRLQIQPIGSTFATSANESRISLQDSAARQSDDSLPI